MIKKLRILSLSFLMINGFASESSTDSKKYCDIRLLSIENRCIRVQAHISHLGEEYDFGKHEMINSDFLLRKGVLAYELDADIIWQNGKVGDLREPALGFKKDWQYLQVLPNLSDDALKAIGCAENEKLFFKIPITAISEGIISLSDSYEMGKKRLMHAR